MMMIVLIVIMMMVIVVMRIVVTFFFHGREVLTKGDLKGKMPVRMESQTVIRKKKV